MRYGRYYAVGYDTVQCGVLWCGVLRSVVLSLAGKIF